MRDDTNYDLYKLINSIDNLDDIKEVKNMIDNRRSELGRQIKSDLTVGDEVSISGSNKIMETGIVEKINRTRAVVMINNVGWNVPFSMIRKVNNG
tara:strand:- start:260 stop:544 length:285 start_codon:yes stop_codon:yes gene_type:complete